MIKMSSEHKIELKKWYHFLEKYDYSKPAAKTAAPKLEGLEPELKAALIRWDEIGELPTIEIEGFTVQGLVEFKGLHVIAAFLMMDWLRREPDEAKAALAEPIVNMVITEELCNRIRQYEEEDSSEKQ